ncbi:MAG: ANTAR domain-containing protein [Aeromicrobium sp.]
MADPQGRLLSRLAIILAELPAENRGVTRLCEAVRRLLEADGTALTMVSPSGAIVVAATDDLSHQLEDLQQVVGQGPSRDAFLRRTVQTADFELCDNERWSLMFEHSRHLEFHGKLIVVPLQPSTELVGLLSARGPADSFAVGPTASAFVGSAIGAALLQEPEMEVSSPAFTHAWASRAQIHQATGMVMAQVGVTSQDALALMRGHAFLNGTELLHVAELLVDRHISFRDYLEDGN